MNQRTAFGRRLVNVKRCVTRLVKAEIKLEKAHCLGRSNSVHVADVKRAKELLDEALAGVAAHAAAAGIAV